MSVKQVAFSDCLSASRLQSIVIFVGSCHRSTDVPFDIQMAINKSGTWKIFAQVRTNINIYSNGVHLTLLFVSLANNTFANMCSPWCWLSRVRAEMIFQFSLNSSITQLSHIYHLHLSHFLLLFRRRFLRHYIYFGGRRGNNLNKTPKLRVIPWDAWAEHSIGRNCEVK